MVSVGLAFELEDAESNLAARLRIRVEAAEATRDRMLALRRMLEAHSGDCAALLHLLIPGEHPVLTVGELPGGELQINYLERRYIVPVEDVIVLPINNTSSENLAAWVGRELRAQIELTQREVPQLSHLSGHMGFASIGEEVGDANGSGLGVATSLLGVEPDAGRSTRERARRRAAASRSGR